MDKISRTDEGKLTSAIKAYCTKKNIPCLSDVNGIRIKGWSHIPDAIIGTEKDDVYTKMIIIEVKPTRDGALNDLKTKEEYRRCKYLAAVYFNGEEMVGQKASWLNPEDGSIGFSLLGPELPLNRLLNSLYEVYQRTTNPVKQQIVDTVNSLIEQGQYRPYEIFNVLSGSFCDTQRPQDLPYSLGQLWSLCEQVSGNSADEIEVLHNIVFRPETRDKRYERGQFITEYPWTLKIAELVVEEFDKHKDFTLYEPCVGTGAITCEVITLLFRKYGKQKTEKIIREQLIVADIDPKMRAFAKIVLWNHTQSLFGQGILVKINESDLTKDSFDLNKMVVFGNYPFNAGSDRNYLARIIRKQLDCELSCAVLMGNSTTFDRTKQESVRILGGKFFLNINKKYTTNDFQQVAVKISVVVFNSTNFPILHSLTNIQNEVCRFLQMGIRWDQLPDNITSIPFLRPIIKDSSLITVELYANNQKIKEYVTKKEIQEICALVENQYLVRKVDINSFAEIKMQDALGTLTEDACIDPGRIEEIQNLLGMPCPKRSDFLNVDDLQICIHFLGRVVPSKFKDNTPFLKHYASMYSIPYFRGVDLKPSSNPIRIPSETAPQNSYEYEMYHKWREENPNGEIQPPHEIPQIGALLVNLLTNTKSFNVKYLPGNYPDKIISGNRAVLMITAPDIKTLALIGLLLLCPGKHIDLLATQEYTGWGLRPKKIKHFNFPKNIPKRLYEIGQTLIIEGKEDDKLRKEADLIIAQLYTGNK